MTVPATARRAGPYSGNGVTTAFGFTFKVFDEADVRVVENTAGVETDAVLNSDYTVTLNGDQEASPGGTVTYPSAPAAGTTITLVGNLGYSQPTDLPEGGSFRAQNVEDALDRQAILAQQLLETIGRTLNYPVGDTASTSLPTATQRASKFLAFNADAEPIAAEGMSSAPVTAFMATVLDDADAATAQATLGGTTVGRAVFTAADAATARGALGSTSVGDAVFVAASAATARGALGFTGTVIDRAFAEYTTNADLTAQIPADDTIPQNTEGTQIISLSFTPKSATSRLRLRFQASGAGSVDTSLAAALFSSASASALKASFVTTSAGRNGTLVLEHEYVPGATSALTFSVRVGPMGAATVRLNGSNASRYFGGTMGATLAIEEIAA